MRRLSAGIWLCGAVAILAILLLLLRACAPVHRCIDKVAQTEAAIGERSEGGGVSRRPSFSQLEAASSSGEVSDAGNADVRSAAAAAIAVTTAAVPDETPLTQDEMAIAEWHLLLDSLCEAEAISDDVKEMQPRVYAAFIALSAKDRSEAISHAMNLLPDDTVGSVYGILFDPSQPADVLNTIFDDVLNRDERIKIPVIRAIADYSDHPLADDAAKILAVVGDEHE